jgi:hypothetical protein
MMTTTSPAVDIVRGLYDAFDRRDAGAIMRTFAPHLEIFQTPLLPWGGTHYGHDGALAFFGKLTSHIDSRVSIERFIEAGDHVIVVGRTRGTVRASGQAFDVAIAHVWTLDGRQAVRWEAYIDTPAMLDALRGEATRV